MPDDIHYSEQKPTAYSYLRFSTPEQLKGDSLRRQVELSRQYAQQHGLNLDENLTFRDLGVSAFTGKNATEGRLGAFLQAVDEGVVLPGSYLLVESLDRLSRQRIMAALQQFQSILERGITVVTLTDGYEYTRESLDDTMKLMMSLMVMARAHEESVTKSKRVGEAWANKRKRAATLGHKLTRTCPAWLTLSDDRRTFIVDKARAKVVRRIYEMYLNGIGKAKIATTFNEEGVPPFGNSQGWHISYIARILRNEAVVGTFQPKQRERDSEGRELHVPDGPPIDGYYPPIVDRAVFLRAQATQQKGQNRSGSRGKAFSNLFSGVAHCSGCGATMRFVNKGNRPGGLDDYYMCSNASRGYGDCSRKLWRYPSVEYAVLQCLMGHIRFTEVFPDFRHRAADSIKKLHDHRLGLLDDLKKAKSRIESVMDTLMDTPSPSLKSRLLELENTKAELEGQVKDIDAQIAIRKGQSSAGATDELTSAIDALVRWFEVHDSCDNDALYTARAKLNALLKQKDVKIHFELADGAEPNAVKGKVHGRIGVRIGEEGTTVKAVIMNKQKKGYMEIADNVDFLLPMVLPVRRDKVDEKEMSDMKENEELLMDLLGGLASR